MSHELPTFEWVIEAGLDKLAEACERLDLRDLSRPGSFELFYGQVIVHFLRGEEDELANHLQSLEKFSGHDEFDFLRTACSMRVQIRSREFESALLQHAIDLASRSERWEGELCILAATAQTVLDDYAAAHVLFARATQAFERRGCSRKSLRSRLNVLVCESHVHPNRNLFARYHDLYRRALRSNQRDLIVATTSLLNISREYQRAGAFLVALKYCNRALSLFELQMGEMNYFLTLAHRAHLLCELGRRAEARIDYEAASVGRFKEVEAALRVIEPMLDGARLPDASMSPDLLPTWRERALSANTSDSTPKLSTLEEKLIRFLANGPRDRIDILEEIYGTQLEFETKLNRFKSLLSTLRKKFPNLVICEDGSYRLADEILIPGLHESDIRKGASLARVGVGN